eukprot:TRINITY_DN13333_c0_g2_i2.p1 TRINITY_DN13333_c0_g2~~TRINITY_DN13333_c0_g2_i2.p1  ORF type:complete len:199 (-),score=40.63 TRINITY_DN13333_c0_g2_i2:57-653(-)
MNVEDPARLQDQELRERRKKQRYQLRYGLEQEMRERGMEDYEKTQAQRLQRMNYRRYVEFMDRGFDILTNLRLDSEEMQKRIHKPQVAEQPTVWDIIEYQKTFSKVPTSEKALSNATIASQKENTHSELEPLSRKDSTPQVGHSAYKQTRTPHRVRSTGVSKGLNRTVISKAGAENVADLKATRSIRTGAFQRSQIKC